MAVPYGNNDKKNTSGGAFTATTEGGTVLGNTTTGDVITKALALKDNATAWNDGTKPKVLADGLQGNQKALTAGTFAYEAAGKYVIASSSSTLSGVASTKMLITARGGVLNSINQLIHDFGADTTSLMREGRYSRTGYMPDGNKLAKRSANLWFDDDGDAYEVPTTLTGNNPWNPVSGATARKSDSAANPTRAIPGELVMKVDFVTLSVASGGDFFDYKAITGM